MITFKQQYATKQERENNSNNNDNLGTNWLGRCQKQQIKFKQQYATKQPFEMLQRFDMKVVYQSKIYALLSLQGSSGLPIESLRI